MNGRIFQLVAPAKEEPALQRDLDERRAHVECRPTAAVLHKNEVLAVPLMSVEEGEDGLEAPAVCVGRRNDVVPVLCKGLDLAFGQRFFLGTRVGLAGDCIFCCVGAGKVGNGVV